MSYVIFRLVQGSHVLVPKLYDHDRCYVFQNPDKQVIFAIPYDRDFTLIGTTERDYVGDPGKVEATAEEIEYLVRIGKPLFQGCNQPGGRCLDVFWCAAVVR